MSETAASRDKIVDLERRFSRGLFGVLILLTAWMWLYNERFSHQVNAVSVDAIGQLDSLPKERRAVVFNEAFNRLKRPHYFSGFSIPSDLVPAKSPWLGDVTQDGVVASFADGVALKTSPETRDWIARARTGRLTRVELSHLEQSDPRLANTLFLILPSSTPSDVTEKRRTLCHRSPQCVRYVLQARHVHHYNALVLLFRFGNDHGFSNETLTFARLNPGFYIAARTRANALGFGPVAREGDVLLSIRTSQIRSIRSMRTTALFFSIGALTLILFQIIKRRSPIERRA